MHLAFCIRNGSHSVNKKSVYAVPLVLETTTASRPVLGPTQPPVQWVPRALSLGVKRPGCEADPSPRSSAKVYSPNTPSWRGAQLKKSTGTTLPLRLPYYAQRSVNRPVPFRSSNQHFAFISHLRHACYMPY
jgi:hypothetical protein